MKKRFLALVGGISFLALNGCSSLTTTPLTRLGDGSITGDSNGEPRWFEKNRSFRGVPVKIKVQTHVDVWIDEEYLLYKNGKDGSWKQKTLPSRFYSVRAEEVMSDQVVICDFKRPASGIIDLNLEFSDDQYFDKIKSQVQDTTITDSAALLSTIITKTGLTPSQRAAKPQTQDELNHSWERRTVAYRRFDINDPDFENQVECFVNQHLNDCNRCDSLPKYSPILDFGSFKDIAPSEKKGGPSKKNGGLDSSSSIIEFPVEK